MVFTYLVSLTHTLLRNGGLKAVVAENLLLKQQLLVPYPVAKTCAQSVVFRSFLPRVVAHLSRSSPDQAGCLSGSTVHPFEIPSGHCEEKISFAVLFTVPKEARASGALSAPH